MELKESPEYAEVLPVSVKAYLSEKVTKSCTVDSSLSLSLSLSLSTLNFIIIIIFIIFIFIIINRDISSSTMTNCGST